MARTDRLGPARRAVNGLFTVLIQNGIGGRNNYLLTTTGRKTGRKRTTPVTLIENPGERWLVSPYGNVGWVYHVRDQPEVSLSRAGRSESLCAEEAGTGVAGLRRRGRAAGSGPPGTGAPRRTGRRPPRSSGR